MYWNRIKRAYLWDCDSKGEARADGGVGVRALYEGEGERRQRVTEEESHGGNEIEALHESLCHSCQSIEVKLRPTAMSVCKRCMKGKDRGGGVAEEGSHGGNEIEALDESVMPFVPVHRGEARTDGDSVRAAVDEEEGWSQRSRGGGEPRR
ncbi:hypothetical protein Scep_028462 [Stephania cephalantha]|uniref:Uncharacterized protein n=1 Tax=Stephania cephalantha TaxID=152367 RepID=A0AAP0E9Z3_9MAGN